MRLCVVSFKECWRNGSGSWYSSGGFPIQMGAIGSLFDSVTLVAVEVEPRAGGMPLPARTLFVPLRSPVGEDLRRKLSVVAHLGSHLRTIVRQVRQADVVHTPVPGDLALLGMITGLLLRKRLLVRYGGSWENNSQSTLMGRLTKLLMRWHAGDRTVMIATGAGSQPPAPGVEWLFATAIAEAEVQAVKPSLHRQPQVPLRLVYPGRLSVEKGVRYIIEALGQLYRSERPGRPTPTLTVAGDGPQRRELEELARTQQCSHLVRFCGQLERGDLLVLLQESDVCVLPSLTESFCKARLDAMLCGTPVLTTPVGFGRELIGTHDERGWLVPAGDGGALARVLDRLVEEAIDWPALRARCRAYAETLTIESWTARIAEHCTRRWGLRTVEGRLRA